MRAAPITNQPFSTTATASVSGPPIEVSAAASDTGTSASV
jgi:hypothetical protein